MSTDIYRVIVQRLLGEPFSQWELARLLLNLREKYRNYAQFKTVVDIGDYLAHKQKRDRGLVNGITREWTAIMGYTIYYMENNYADKKPIDMSRMPSYYLEFLKAQFTRADDNRIRSSTGFRNRRDAEKVLKNIVRLTTANSDGTLRIRVAAGSVELALIKELSFTLQFPVHFTSERLHSELRGCLISEKLLRHSEVERFSKFEIPLSLFAISQMHNCTIRNEITDARLRAHTSWVGDEKRIEVGADCRLPDSDWQPMFFPAIFSSSLDWSYFDDRLLIEPEGWNFDIEVTPSLKLDRVR